MSESTFVARSMRAKIAARSVRVDQAASTYFACSLYMSAPKNLRQHDQPRDAEQVRRAHEASKIFNRRVRPLPRLHHRLWSHPLLHANGA